MAAAVRDAIDIDVMHCLRSPLGGLFRHVCDLVEGQSQLGIDRLSSGLFLAHAGRNPAVRERLAAIFESWHRFIADMLRVSRENGIVRNDLDIDFLARSAVALIEGTILQSRLSRGPRQLDDLVEPLCALLTELLEAR